MICYFAGEGKADAMAHGEVWLSAGVAALAPISPATTDTAGSTVALVPPSSFAGMLQ